MQCDSASTTKPSTCVSVENGALCKKQYKLHDWKPSSYPNLILTEKEWEYIFDSEKNKFRTTTYVNFFVKKLNNMGIACILVAEYKYDRHSVVLSCKHPTCNRSYKIVSYLKNLKFEIFFDGEFLHESGVYTTRPVNGDKRVESKNELRVMGTKKFAEKMRKEADRNLTAQGNLDTIKSKSTYSHMKSEILSENDFDKDHIKDLSKMRDQQIKDVLHHLPGSEVFIQHVSSNDFYVHAFSNTQIRILKQLISSGVPVTIHVDATGSIIMAPEGVEKRIYYYVASVALPVLDEQPKILFPLIEMISSAHDAFTIETWLRKFKDEFIRQVGCWSPPAHFVTDFSFAILNAASSALNREDLIEFVNRTYDELINEDKPDIKYTTPLHICCNHFMKTTAQDVNSHFPPSQSSTVVRTFLKETLATMFNMTDLELLSNVYQNLSIILNSKYITEDVNKAFNFIKDLVNKTNLKQTGESKKETVEGNIEILEFDEPKDDPMYKQSKFYKMFDKITYRPNYDNKSENLNNFYCPRYCNLLLSKYISILPLWTCLNCEVRKSNSNAESLFNIVKSGLKENAEIIGHVPIRSSRFLRFTRKMINDAADEFWELLPRYNCCNKKRQRSTSKSPHVVTKKRRINSPASPYVRSNDPFSVHETYSKSPNTNQFHRSPMNSTNTTPKSSRILPRRVSQLSQSTKLHATKESLSSPKLSRVLTRSRHASQSSQHKDDETNEESYTPKLSRRSSATQSPRNMEDLTSAGAFHTPSSSSSCYIGDPNATESWGPKRKKAQPKHTYFQSNLLKKFDSPKVFNQLFHVKDQRVTATAKLKNSLLDDPNIYFKPTEPFIVASTLNNRSILSNFDFQSLQINRQITPKCIDFVLQLFSAKRKDVQFVFFETLQLLNKNLNVPKMRCDNVIGIINENGVYSLLIVNLKNNNIAYINLKLDYSSEEMLQNFLKFLTQHNKAYKTSYGLQGWSNATMNFPTLQYGNINDSGVYVLRFVQDLIKENTISKKEFDVDLFRISLSHYVLHNSALMKKLCLICGRNEDKDIKNPIVDWIECESCNRWCHKICLKSTTFNIAFKCILCTE